MSRCEATNKNGARCSFPAVMCGLCLQHLAIETGQNKIRGLERK